MINWFDMPAEGLSNGGLFEVKELEVTENGTYETKGEMYNKVTVNVEGGGGSSDFSTAQVTVNQSGDPTGYYWDNCPMLDVENNLLKGDAYTETSKAVLTVPLYKGKCYWDLSLRGLQLSGNIEEFWEGLLITGDCTITIS